MKKFLKVCGKIVKWYTIYNTLVWAIIGMGKFLNVYIDETTRLPIDSSISDIVKAGYDTLDDCFDDAITGLKRFFKIAIRVWF